MFWRTAGNSEAEQVEKSTIKYVRDGIRNHKMRNHPDKEKMDNVVHNHSIIDEPALFPADPSEGLVYVHRREIIMLIDGMKGQK